MTWDLARLWHHLAELHPDRTALIHGSEQLTWQQFDTAAAGFAETLRQAGIARGDVVALCLPNSVSYLVLLAGTLRCGATPCGINYRHRPHELTALLDRLRPAVVCHQSTDIRRLATALPTVRLWHQVPDSVTSDAQQRLLESGTGPQRIDSRPDDLLLKCTGGTTASPLAVRWRIGDILTQLNDHNPWQRHDLTGDTLQTTDHEPVRLLVASPLMHGSGLTRAMGALCAGGTVITNPVARFDAVSLLDTAAHHRATSIAIVGDSHALPLADALDYAPGHWTLPDLTTITSSGAAWTSPVKYRVLRSFPHVTLLESLGATEATGLGFSIATVQKVPRTGEFTLGRHAQVFTSDTRTAQPGETGAIGVSWPQPAGLHPEGELPADRFLHLNGVRYLMSGDHVRMLDNDRLQWLGRGADCINAGGEKVWAPEVADVLRRHPGVHDALVLGIAHQRLGQTVAALVHLHPDTTTIAVLEYTRAQMSGYKVPTIMLSVPSIPVTLAGKPDLTAARSLLKQREADHS